MILKKCKPYQQEKNGVGNIVTFNGVVIATDRSDSNSKAVLYDNKKI
ncbi:MAG: hypothetical protein L6U99_04525 [Clostridium sp.]|nr:MAG: hypothetical protein L6U99_04525 [Clostridium sp.]